MTAAATTSQLPALPDLSLDARSLPHGAHFLRILGVNYAHVKTEDEGDLYLTEHGLPLMEHLLPQNWYEPVWFLSKRERLEGTSTVYRVPTRPLRQRACPSIDLVVKWSRVGEDVPLNTFTLNKAINAEFNTPFEEFSLVEELRAGRYGPPNLHILMQRPLAIFVPPERMQLWQTGRSKSKIMGKIARHPGVEIDILRSYILLYQWIKGVNAVQAYQVTTFDAATQQRELEQLTHRVTAELEQKGFTVADNKPTHFIVRVDHVGRLKHRQGKLAYALIDYELLARTPSHEDAVRASMRSKYLSMQRDRFKRVESFPSHLWPSEVMNVPYIFGRTESTNGTLWVVGRNPELFNYFLPERWRTKQIALSKTNQTYYTQTKDRIHLVWKVSRVGDLPPGDFTDEGYEGLLLQGYNSPFEEFAIALELQAKGVRTTYPRAIYMTGQESELSGRIVDDRRFEQAKDLLSPEGLPVLRMDRDYITIWGYFRGLEDAEATSEAGHWTPIDAQQACAKGIIAPDLYQQILQRQAQTLRQAGFVDEAAKGDHILLSYVPERTVKRDSDGFPELRQCNFEMLRRIE
jgi:hypothetical protein